MKQLNIRRPEGYFHISISASHPSRCITSNNERAFIISCLQDSLTQRTFIDETNGHQRFAARVDLLAFSINESSIELLTFAISRSTAVTLARLIVKHVAVYRSEYVGGAALLDAFNITVKQLDGPHHALHTSLLFHCRHNDWEYDRYSSISFFLHDRRGDWVRPWRICQLYCNDPEAYRALIEAQLPYSYANSGSVVSSLSAA